MFGNDQLIAERERQQSQLDELTLHPGSSPAVGQLRSSIESEVATDYRRAGATGTFEAPLVTTAG